MNAQPENINRFQNHSIENNDCELYLSNIFNQNPRVNEHPINDGRQCLSINVLRYAIYLLPLNQMSDYVTTLDFQSHNYNSFMPLFISNKHWLQWSNVFPLRELNFSRWFIAKTLRYIFLAHLLSLLHQHGAKNKSLKMFLLTTLYNAQHFYN